MKGARDARGRRISLLNDDDLDTGGGYATAAPSYYASYAYPPRTASTPNTPQLLRSDSFGYQSSAEPMSPLTPLSETAVRFMPAVADARSVYDDYYPLESSLSAAGMKRRPSLLSDGRSASYESDSLGTTATSSSSEKSARRYYCRFRESLGCMQDFSTSGHASRHARAHTNEKAVACTFDGCDKKFTRADNMKQHLRTHDKQKPRGSSSSSAFASATCSSSATASSSASAASTSRACRASHDKRASMAGRHSSRKRVVAAAEAASAAAPPMPSPSPPATDATAAWDPCAELSLPVRKRPRAVHAPASGLDALVMAAACQEAVHEGH